ncbi:MAG: hypothetical protein EOO59_13300 [Hymenobacter sp.]|nr:MAG: hypothetical protein EOO59_13300 [Hymenobacter sp.]
MTSLPRLPHLATAPLLLLGLLGLLLWGQCTFNPNGSSPKKRPAANLHLHTAVRVVRIDSASTHGPDRLYLTLALQNFSSRPCRLASLACALWLDKQRVGYNLTSTTPGTELPAQGEETFAVTLTPYGPIYDRPATDFKLLRAAWQQGQLAQHQAQLEIFYEYYPADGYREQANRRVRTVPLGR